MISVGEHIKMLPPRPSTATSPPPLVGRWRPRTAQRRSYEKRAAHEANWQGHEFGAGAAAVLSREHTRRYTGRGHSRPVPTCVPHAEVVASGAEEVRDRRRSIELDEKIPPVLSLSVVPVYRQQRQHHSRAWGGLSAALWRCGADSSGDAHAARAEREGARVGGEEARLAQVAGTRMRNEASSDGSIGWLGPCCICSGLSAALCARSVAAARVAAKGRFKLVVVSSKKIVQSGRLSMFDG